MDADRRRRSRQDLGHRFKSSNRQGRHRALRGPLASCAPVIGPLNTLSLGVCSPARSIVLAAKRRTELERLFRNAKVDGTSDAHRNHHRSRRWDAERTAQRDSPPSHRPTKPSTSQHLTSSPIRLSRLESPCSVFLGANSNSRVPDSFAKQDWPQTSLQSWSHFVCSFLISVRLATPVVSSRRMPCPAHSG